MAHEMHPRHCEERRDEAIQALATAAGLLRGVYHRAGHFGPDRWLAMTKEKNLAASNRYAAAAGMGVVRGSRPASTRVTLSKPASSRLSRACVVV
jgi:hypothetical protein